MKEESRRLLINVLVLLVIGAGVFVVYFFYFRSEDQELTIDDTPLKIESIRNIAEISTVSYRDEVVMDTVELDNSDYSIYDYRKYTNWYNDGVKRRLTLIVKGEIRFGFDLKSKDFAVMNSGDSVLITLPQPKILDIIITPSKTEVFQEQGEWDDKTRRSLENKAKLKLKINSEQMDLKDKARSNAVRLFKNLLGTSRIIIIKYKMDA